MKRSIFLLIAAGIGFLPGLMMFFAPEKTAEGFGVAPGKGILKKTYHDFTNI